LRRLVDAALAKIDQALTIIHQYDARRLYRLRAEGIVLLLSRFGSGHSYNQTAGAGRRQGATP
jgi:hypothetical protein